jgi:hypothetical protein
VLSYQKGCIAQAIRLPTVRHMVCASQVQEATGLAPSKATETSTVTRPQQTTVTSQQTAVTPQQTGTVTGERGAGGNGTGVVQQVRGPVRLKRAAKHHGDLSSNAVELLKYAFGCSEGLILRQDESVTEIKCSLEEPPSRADRGAARRAGAAGRAEGVRAGDVGGAAAARGGVRAGGCCQGVRAGERRLPVRPALGSRVWAGSCRGKAAQRGCCLCSALESSHVMSLPSVPSVIAWRPTREQLAVLDVVYTSEALCAGVW